MKEERKKIQNCCQRSCFRLRSHAQTGTGTNTQITAQPGRTRNLRWRMCVRWRKNLCVRGQAAFQQLLLSFNRAQAESSYLLGKLGRLCPRSFQNAATPAQSRCCFCWARRPWRHWSAEKKTRHFIIRSIWRRCGCLAETFILSFEFSHHDALVTKKKNQSVLHQNSKFRTIKGTLGLAIKGPGGLMENKLVC